jgi:hypothetical protein
VRCDPDPESPRRLSLVKQLRDDFAESERLTNEVKRALRAVGSEL